jgi:hypothetical protein
LARLDLEHAHERGPDTPEPRAGVANEQEALEVIDRGLAHTVTVEVAVEWDDP